MKSINYEEMGKHVGNSGSCLPKSGMFSINFALTLNRV